MLRVERVRDPRRRPLLVVITDGRATDGPDAVERCRRAARWSPTRGRRPSSSTASRGRSASGSRPTLAHALQATHLPIAEVSAQALAGVARVA